MHFLRPRQKQHPFQCLSDAERPDIFVITVDMVPPEFYRPSRCKDIMDMRAWDSMAEDSISFNNAFSVSPLCGPSRAAMFTGRYPYIQTNEERAHDGFALELRQDETIFPEYLKATGYLTAHVGKSHIGTEKFIHAFGESCSPWNRWAPPVYDDPEYHEFLNRQSISGFRFRRDIRGLKTDRRTQGNHYGGWLEQDNGTDFPVQATYPHYLVERSIAHLDSLLKRRKSADEPLYLQLDFFAPHQPFMIPSGLEEREQEMRKLLELPEGYRCWADRGFCSAANEPKVYRTYRKNWGMYDRDTAKDYLIANMLQMEVIDRALKKFVKAIKDRGLYRNAMMITTADHGEMNLHEGLIDKGSYGHPKAAMVPLLLKLPGNESARAGIDQPVCLLDIAPTLFEAAGVKPLAHLDGESLFRRLRPGDEGRERNFLFETGWHITSNFAVAIQIYESPSRHYRYVYNLCDEQSELYDMNDVSFTNLIGDPKYSNILKQAVSAMNSVLSEDPRWRCYRQAFSLDHAEMLEQTEGDNQMFIPR